MVLLCVLMLSTAYVPYPVKSFPDVTAILSLLMYREVKQGVGKRGVRQLLTRTRRLYTRLLGCA